MTYYDDYLEHHGVKGMKWGVRRYKDARKEGKKADRDRDYSTSKIRSGKKNAAKMEKKAKQYDSVGNKLKAQAARNDKKHYEKVVSTNEARLKDANKRYESAVAKAANQKVVIKRRDKLAKAKRAGKKVAYGAVVGNTAGKLTGNSVIAGGAGATAAAGLKARKTRNDRFAESVDAAQKRKK